MQLKFLKNDNCNLLYESIDENFKNGNYFKERSWLSDFFKDDFEGITNIELDSLSLIPSSERIHEFENCKKVYLALKNLTVQQATEPQIWTYLTHVTCWDYMFKRWPISNKDDDLKKIKARYFLHYQSKDRRMIRNGISRFWWFAYTTYDESYKDDPFYLTKELLYSHEQDFSASLFTRSFSRNPDIVKNIIKAICKYEEIFMDNKKINREIHRPLFVEINRIGAVKLLDELDYEDIEEIIFGFISNFKKRNELFILSRY